MLDQLPSYIDPLHFADKRGELHGEISLNRFSRLADFLANDEGTVKVDMIFDRAGRLAKAEGHLQAVLQLKCQNCLEALEYPIDSVIKLGIITAIDQAEKLPEDFEPLLVGEGQVLLTDVIEDELLLLLPEYPKHDHGCLLLKSNNEARSLLADQQSVKQNPFSILAKLKP